MYDMWLCGELMIHHREGFDRVYDFRENIAPREFDQRGRRGRCGGILRAQGGGVDGTEAGEPDACGAARVHCAGTTPPPR